MATTIKSKSGRILATVNEADLCQADLCEANLRGADLRGAKITTIQMQQILTSLEVTISNTEPTGNGRFSPIKGSRKLDCCKD